MVEVCSGLDRSGMRVGFFVLFMTFWLIFVAWGTWQIVSRTDEPTYDCVQATIFYESPEGMHRIGQQEKCGDGEWSNIYGPSFEVYIEQLRRDLRTHHADGLTP
jgi:hypothetical protein